MHAGWTQTGSFFSGGKLEISMFISSIEIKSASPPVVSYLYFDMANLEANLIN